jgi:hypothetical protein
MRGGPAVKAVALALALLGAAAPACRRERPALPGCQSDDQCDLGEACTARVCLPLRALPAEWAVELEPLSTAEGGLVELGPGAAPPSMDLVSPAKVTMEGTLSLEPAAPPLTLAHVVLTVPPGISGQPDLVFENDVSVKGSTAPHFSLALPAGVLGRAGTLRVLPTGDQARTQAPTKVSLTVAAAADVAVSAKSVSVLGRVRSASDREPPAPLVARAFQDGELVSNVDVTTADGAFTLVLPMARVGPTPEKAVTVQLTPAAGDTSSPRLVLKPLNVTANLDLGDLRLPAFSQPNVFRFAIRGDAAGGPVVADATVRARTALADDAAGLTEFMRDALSDVTGSADLALLPGSTASLRNYEVAVVPPPDSPYAIKCVAKLPLSSGGSAAMPTSPAAFVLARRTVLSGTVRRADQVAVAGVVIVATRTANDPSTPCAAAVSVQPATATTDATGAFRLYLDPGTYRIDYDPPAGTPAPRLTETGYVVSAPTAPTSITRPQTLPAGAVLEGTARDGAGAPLRLAAVRVLQPTCTSPETCAGPGRVAPTLIGRTRTDADGHFRVIVPAPSSP